MKFLRFFAAIVLFASITNLSAQSLTLGSGVFVEHYRPVGVKSPYYSKKQNYSWAFMGGSISFDFKLEKTFFHTFSVYANAYPLTYGSSVYLGEYGRFDVVGEDLIAPEIGFLGHYDLLNKPKFKISAGLGLATRFVVDPITGESFSFVSDIVTYNSEHIQKKWFTLSIPLELRLTYQFNDFVGLTFGVKRTFGFFHWVEESISYEMFDIENGTSEIGTASMATNGNRSVYELGLVFYFNKKK